MTKSNNKADFQTVIKSIKKGVRFLVILDSNFLIPRMIQKTLYIMY